jgi:hypothetical protein
MQQDVEAGRRGGVMPIGAVEDGLEGVHREQSPT